MFVRVSFSRSKLQRPKTQTSSVCKQSENVDDGQFWDRKSLCAEKTRSRQVRNPSKQICCSLNICFSSSNLLHSLVVCFGSFLCGYWFMSSCLQFCFTRPGRKSSEAGKTSYATSARLCGPWDQLPVPMSEDKAWQLLFDLCKQPSSSWHPAIGCFFCQKLKTIAGDWEVASKCYLLIFPSTFSALSSSDFGTMWTRRLCNFCCTWNSHINHRHDTIASPSERSSSHLQCATSLATSWLRFLLSLSRFELDVNKINLLLPHQSCHKFTPFAHSSTVFPFYNIIVMLEIIYSVLSLLHKMQQLKSSFMLHSTPKAYTRGSKNFMADPGAFRHLYIVRL